MTTPTHPMGSAAAEPDDDGQGDLLELAEPDLTYTVVFDWVQYSGVTPIAHSLYVILKSFIWDKSGRAGAFPGMITLAVFLKLARDDKVKRYMDELKKIGAITVQKVGMPARNKYLVHEKPPKRYTGPRTYNEWKAANGETLMTMHLKALEDAAKKKAAREAREAKAKTQNGAVPLFSGEQEDEPPVPLKRGEHDPLSRGEHDPLKTGDEVTKEEVTKEEVTLPPLPPPATPEEGEPNTPETPNPDPVAALIAEAVELAPHWRPNLVAAALQMPDVTDRPWPVVEHALRQLAEGVYGPTASPRRLAAAGPWWEAAHRAAKKTSHHAPKPQPRTACGLCHGAKTVDQTLDTRTGTIAGPDVPPQFRREVARPCTCRSTPTKARAAS